MNRENNQNSFLDKRNTADLVADTILLLYLINKIWPKGKKPIDKTSFEAKVRIMKTVFLSEYFMVKERMKGFNFFFNIYHYGPSSLNVLDLLDDLLDSELIEENRKENEFGYRIKEKASKNLNFYIKDFTPQKIDKFLKIIDGVVKKYGHLEYKNLIEKIYSLNVIPYKSKRGTLNIKSEVAKHNQEPKYKPKLLEKMDKKDYDKELPLDRGWKETFLVLTSPNLNRIITE